MGEHIDLFAAGNALMEATIRVDDQVLELAGVPKGGMQLVDAERMLSLQRQWTGHGRSFVPAGAECNVATGVACLGGRSFFTGRVGKDEVGGDYHSRLVDLGVCTRLVRGTEPTGQILSFVTSDGERSMVTHLGAASRFSVEDLDTERIPSSKAVFISAFFFQPDSTRATAFAVVDAAKSHRVPIAFDVSDSMLVLADSELVKTVVEDYADVVFLNEAELRAVGLICGETPEIYLGKHASTVVVKRGQRGATVLTEGRACEVAGFPVDAVDTTGAGDAFAAGFLLATIRGCTPMDAGKVGCRLASYAVAQYGSCLLQKVLHAAPLPTANQ